MPAPKTEVFIRAADGTELLRATLAPGEYVLGRDAACALCVDDPSLSREHARLTINFDHALIEDLSSANGTKVNGTIVSGNVRLWPNQKIQAGSVAIELRRVKTVVPDATLTPSAETTRALLPEEILREKKYDIGGVVAQGGMGAILNAKEAAIERTVAMKVMLDGSAADELVRFVAEAKVTGQLEHPNIVPVHELGVDENGQVFYTMKFVRGITLRKVLELLAGGEAPTLEKYPLATLLTIFQKVCDAVAFAHSKGVIHRDLKPENIMLGDFGEVLVMDWGLAKVLKPESGKRKAESDAASDLSGIRSPLSDFGTATMTGSIMGTPQYMAPEQARGEVEQLDERADIYALGAILYHVLALRPSVTGEDAYAIVERVARGEIDPLPKAARAIPDSLAAVVREAMALEKTHRYASVADLQADITAFQNGFATSAEHAGLVKQVALLIRRHRGIFATAAAAWLLITVLAVWFVVNLRAKEKRAVAGEAVAVQEKEAARRSSARANLALAEAAQREGNGPGMQAALGEVPENLRDSTWHYLLAQSDTSLARIRTSTTDIGGVAAHPTQAGVFAVADRAGKITLLDMRTGARLLEFAPGFKKIDPTLRLAFSPDGERIAIGQWGRDGGIVIHGARDGEVLATWAAPPTSRLEFSPDGKSLLQGAQNQPGLGMWDADTGQLRWRLEVAGDWKMGRWMPDGQSVLTFDFRDKLRLIKASDGSLVRPLSKESVFSFAVHPVGRMVVLALRGGAVQGIRMADGAVLFENKLPDRRGSRLAFTADGTRFLHMTTLTDGRQALLLCDAETGEPAQTLFGGSGPIDDAAVHPLSGELLVAGPNARAWDLVGTPPKWKSARGNSALVFWTSDDVIFARHNAVESAVLNLQASSPAVLWRSPEGAYHEFSVSKDLRLAAIGVPMAKRPILLLRFSGSAVEQVATIQLSYSLRKLRLSPDGSRLLSAEASGGLRIYDTATGVDVAKVDRTGVQAFNDLGWLDGQQFLGLVTAGAARGESGSEEKLVVWDAATGRIARTVTHHTAMDALAIAPDGRRFAEAGADRCVRIRNAATLAVEREFRAHDAGITALAWHPTEPIVATASADLSIRLWNIETGRRLEELRGPLATPDTLAFSPSGQRLGCAAKGDGGYIWEPPSLRKEPPP
ncbi:MAG: protein kinase [Chthoniobacteraceae bacterium]